MIYIKYSRLALSLLVLATALFAQRDAIPLKNWATPLYWHASQTERAAATRPVPQLQFSMNAVSTDALTFVAITPCRLVDTRGAAGGFDGVAPFSGPAIAAGGTLMIPVQSSTEASTNTMPAPCGTIPSSAQAYSLNVTVVPAATGGVNYITLWPAAYPQPVVSTINDVQGDIVANAAIVPAGSYMSSGGISVYNSGPAVTNVIIDMNGYYAAPSDLNYNTAIGYRTLELNTTGSGNTASGFDALLANTSGGINTASGYDALEENTTGTGNAANGAYALLNNTSGSYNTAIGLNALAGNNTGGSNTAIGDSALQRNTTGSYNTGIGDDVLPLNSIGINNIAIGAAAGNYVPDGNNYSIYIGSLGSNTDNSGTVRIGDAGMQLRFFAAGIRGVTTGNNDAIPVLIDSNGQLGTVSSSRRFKEDIQDMGDASSGLLRLRPVTFRYKRPFADGSKPIEYGLIAEEVGEVYPDLVAHSADGEIETVKYQVLDSMLLNELQKQHETIQQLEARLEGALAKLATTAAAGQ